MQRITLVRYTTKPQATAENETLSRAVFKELDRNQPRNTAYAMGRSGNDFVHLFVNSADIADGQLVDLPSFKAFLKDIGERYVAPPDVVRLDVPLVKSYGLP